MRRPRLVLLLLGALALGCSDKPGQLAGGGGASGSGGAPGGVMGDHWTPSDPMAGGPPPGALGQGKTARRLSVAQLRRSIPQLFGGATWTSGTNQLFDTLARTLGEADYVQVTYDNLQPNPLFAKFMDDMAGQVCGKAVPADAMQADPAQKQVVRYPMDVDANLRFLRLKLHGILVPEGQTAGLSGLQKLFADVKADTNSADKAWIAVCVAMVTAPELMSY